MTKAQEVLNEIWLAFPPRNLSQYREQRGRLIDIRRSSSKRDRIALDSAMVSLADAIGEVDEMLKHSEEIAKDKQTKTAEGVVAILLRLKALHIKQRHDEEIALAEDVSLDPNLAAEDVVRLLHSVVQHHPATVDWSSKRKERVLRSARAEPLRSVQQPRADGDFDDFVLRLANQLRVWNEQQMAQFR